MAANSSSSRSGPRDLFAVEGRIVLVTGGAGKLGSRYVSALVERGARVAVLDCNLDNQSYDRRWQQRHSDTLIFLNADVVDRPSLEAALQELETTWGPPDALVNNAAIDSPPDAEASENGPFESYPEDSWSRVLDVNLKGVFQCCQVFGGAMARARGGSIVNISSIYGLVSPDQRIYEYRRDKGQAFFKPAAYSASKSALLNLTRYLATYWAPQGVRVNTLTLGGVENNQDPSFLDGYCARVPLGRMAHSDEYCGAVIFLISAASSYMTGSNLVLDGGWTAW